MIRTQDLSKSFNDFLAVDRVTLHVEAGEVLALLGPNGAGKTTTLRMLTSVLRPSTGWARVAGFDVVSQAQQVRSSVGILTEQHGLYGRMTATEYLDFYGQVYHLAPAVRRQRSKDLLDKFGLGGEVKRRIGEYSKGMRQKLALARALFHDPPVLLMDEPTSAMDPESARLVRDAIHGLRSAQRAIIICTHNLAEAEELADKIAIISLGSIIISGEVEQLKTQLLGAPQFELRLGAGVDETSVSLPTGVDVTARGSGWLRYRAVKPEETNPRVLQALVSQGIPVMGLAEVPRSLESVYLQAIGATQGNNGSEHTALQPLAGENTPHGG
jgi:ABC-2 type transport system ATP-binding protein